MKNMTEKFTFFMLGMFVITPLSAMVEETIENNGKSSSVKMTFKDDSQIEIMPKGCVKITNEGEALEFNEEGKPIFKTDTGESVIEYSGAATDKNQQRSWAIAYFEPNGSSIPHYHAARTEDYYITSKNAQALITVDGHEHLLRTGDHLRILPNQVHGVINLSQDQTLSLIVKCFPSWVYSDVNFPVKK